MVSHLIHRGGSTVVSKNRPVSKISKVSWTRLRFIEFQLYTSQFVLLIVCPNGLLDFDVNIDVGVAVLLCVFACATPRPGS